MVSSFEEDIQNELAESLFLIREPLDLSNQSNFLIQNQPISNYFTGLNNLPLCLLYLDLGVPELVANDKYETSVSADFSIIYHISPEESLKSGLEKGKKCLEQFTDNIKLRQREGTSLMSFYLNGSPEINADTPNGIDYSKTTYAVAIATAKLTLNYPEVANE